MAYTSPKLAQSSRNHECSLHVSRQSHRGVCFLFTKAKGAALDFQSNMSLSVKEATQLWVNQNPWRATPTPGAATGGWAGQCGLNGIYIIYIYMYGDEL